MSDYLARHTGTRQTPQGEPIPGTDQVQMESGGYGWQIDDWARLDRFLILGTEGGTYYVGEARLTRDSAESVARCIQEDGQRTVDRIVEISTSGRAPKNDPALYALAMASALGDTGTRRAAYAALPKVARIGTHLFHFLTYRELFGGWGRGLRRAVRSWYMERDPDALAYQLIKYRQRDGWSHADVLRLAKPRPERGSAHDRLFGWTVGKVSNPERFLVEGYERAQRASTATEWADLIREYRLPREALPTEALNHARVWDALLEDMPVHAMVRNLGNMSKVGLLTAMSDAAKIVTTVLSDAERLRKARLHPIQVLAALVTYAQGEGFRGSGTWDPVTAVVDALDAAFYTTFENVEPTGKRTLLALDVSSSMGWGQVAGVPALTPRAAAAAMALVTAATEPQHQIMAFSHTFVKLPISKRMRLDTVINKTQGLWFGGTDCALPMQYARKHGLEVDTFVVYTDSETWFGNVHPAQALAQYRRESGIPAKLVVVGMVGNEFTIADPRDPGMLDVVGFDTATPNAIAEFAR